MSEFKHTPGPWMIGGEHDCMTPIYVGIEGEEYDVCQVCTWDGFPPGEVGPENAKLIAAAPDLLEACNSLLEMLEEWDSGFTKPGEEFAAVTEARAAIAKATARHC